MWTLALALALALGTGISHDSVWEWQESSVDRV